MAPGCFKHSALDAAHVFLAAVFTCGTFLAGRPHVRRLTSTNPALTAAVSVTNHLVFSHASSRVPRTSAPFSNPAFIANALSTLALTSAAAEAAVVLWTVKVAAFTKASRELFPGVLCVIADAEVVGANTPPAADRGRGAGATVVFVCAAVVSAEGLRAQTLPAQTSATAVTFTVVGLRFA